MGITSSTRAVNTDENMMKAAEPEKKKPKVKKAARAQVLQDKQLNHLEPTGMSNRSKGSHENECKVTPMPAERRVVPISASDFDTNFPKLMASVTSPHFCEDIDAIQQRLQSCSSPGVSEAIETVFRNLLAKLSSTVDEEIESYLNWYWKDHKLQAHGDFVSQTLYVFSIMVNDPEYQVMSRADKEIVKWATLLHNIGRVGWPLIQGEDYTYAFTSA